MVRVSVVEKLPSRKMRIVLDDDTSYTLLSSVYRERPLEVGEEVDSKEYAQWVLTRQYRSALDKAVTMLAARACSKGEIMQKLRRVGYSSDTVEMVIYKLEKHKLLDDRAFAEQWVRYRGDQKYGPRRISRELRGKGVSAEETESALESLPEEQLLEDAISLAEKAKSRFHPEEDPVKCRRKMLEYLVRRGYDWELSRQAVDRVLEPED